MATKKAKTTNNMAKLNQAKATVKKVNNDIIDYSFDTLKTVMKNGEKWQKLGNKLVKKSEPLRKKQAKILAETTDALKTQLDSGAERLKTLVGYDPAMLEQLKETVAKNPLAQKAEKVAAKIKSDVTETLVDAKGKIDNAKKKFENATKEVKSELTDAAEEVSEVVEKTTVKVKKTIEKTVKKEAVAKSDLKVIHKIGPKMETILNENGINSYQDLAKMTLKNLETLLTKADVNTNLYNLSDWKAQAKLAAKGDLKGVEKLIKEVQERK